MRFRETFTANQTKTFHVVGTFVKVAALTGVLSGTVTLRLFRNNERLNLDLSGLDAGQGARVPQDLGPGFDQIEVTSTEAQNVTLQVLGGEAVDNRVTGEVSVIDGGKARSAANQAYLVWGELAALAAQYSHLQLWNPAASGKRVIIRQVRLMTQAILQVQWRSSAAALATLLGTGTAKLLPGVVSSAEIRSEQNAVIQGSAMFYSQNDTANKELPYDLMEPFVLNAGRGLIFVPTPVNSYIQIGLQFNEEAV